MIWFKEHSGCFKTSIGLNKMSQVKNLRQGKD